MSAGNGLIFGPSFKDYGSSLKSGLDNIADGFNVYGDGSIRTILRHEFGHGVRTMMRRDIFYDEWNKDGSLKIGGAVKQNEFDTKLRKLSTLKGVSEYARTNEEELFSEGFAAFTSGEKTEFANEFGKLLTQYVEVKR